MCTMPAPSSIEAPENAIKPTIPLEPLAIAPCSGSPVKAAKAIVLKYVPSIVPRLCTWPPATSTKLAVIKLTTAPLVKPKRSAKAMSNGRDGENAIGSQSARTDTPAPYAITVMVDR